MPPVRVSRRRLLAGAVCVGAGAGAFATLPSTIVRAFVSPGFAATVAVDGTLVGRGSEDVLLEGAPDPAGGGRGEVVHVTSGGVRTDDYAVSIADVRHRGLRVREVTSIVYDYYLPSVGDNTVGDRRGVGPDEAWLILDGDGGRREVFRTFNHPVEAGVWHTRDVRIADGFRPPWKEVSKERRESAVVGKDLAAAYGGAEVLGVGVGRGDPVVGPSKLDVYYDDLLVNGRHHELPLPGRG